MAYDPAMVDSLVSFDALFLFALLVAVPAALARWLATSCWVQIGCAFAIWGGIIWSMVSGVRSSEDALLWAGFFGVFGNWLAIPLIALALRLTNSPDWLIARLQK